MRSMLFINDGNMLFDCEATKIENIFFLKIAIYSIFEKDYVHILLQFIKLSMS